MRLVDIDELSKHEHLVDEDDFCKYGIVSDGDENDG